VKGSTSKACNAEVRAPVSTLALMRGMPSPGSATHSRQPSTWRVRTVATV